MYLVFLWCQVVMVLKKEVVKTQNSDSGDKLGEYRQLLVQAIHSCAVKFPDVAGSVVYMLMDFMGDSNTASALDVVFFVREIAETNPKLRQDILQHLMNTFYQIRSSRVCSCALWIIGEYAESQEHIDSAIEVLKARRGPWPSFPSFGSCYISIAHSSCLVVVNYRVLIFFWIVPFVDCQQSGLGSLPFYKDNQEDGEEVKSGSVNMVSRPFPP
jgi:vesicle coat complex subunit